MNWVKTNGKTNEEMTAATVLRPRRDSRLSVVTAWSSATADGTGLLGITSEPFPPDCFDRCRRWRWQIRPSIRALNRFFRPHSSSGADQDTTASADEKSSRRYLASAELPDVPGPKLGKSLQPEESR